MKVSLRVLPVILFFVFYALIQVSFTSLRHFHVKEDEKEIKAIQEIVVDRFKRYLEFPHMIGMLGGQFLADGKIRTGPYEEYAKLIIQSNSEFLGFNVMDDKGVIFRVFPQDKNTKALGRMSQNLGPALESYQKREPFFLSAPFRLFQGQQGFVFYFPVKSGQKLDGWYAIVISSEAFLQRFSLDDFLKIFDLVIYDEESGLDFFATSIVPSDGKKVYSTKTEMFGRKMVFKSWRKSESLIYEFPWYFSVVMALLLAIASALMLKLYELRKKAHTQLEHISILLRVTSKEALSNLIDIHGELNRMNLPADENVQRFSRDINYLTNLIEQIDLLQTMADSKEGLTDSGLNFVQIIRKQIENYQDVLKKKNVRTDFNEGEFQKIVLHMNVWLLENSVLSNVFSHLLIHAENGSTLSIENKSTGNTQIVKFRVKRQASGEQAKVLSRRMEVARKVLQMHQGELREEINSDDELIISMICKA